MAELTKEGLIAAACSRIDFAKQMLRGNQLALAAKRHWEIELSLSEIALAALTAEPFMYGIVGPEGEAYFDECCVSGGKSDLSEIVSNLNDQCESPGEEYREAPLYRMPMLEGLK